MINTSPLFSVKRKVRFRQELLKLTNCNFSCVHPKLGLASETLIFLVSNRITQVVENLFINLV